MKITLTAAIALLTLAQQLKTDSTKPEVVGPPAVPTLNKYTLPEDQGALAIVTQVNTDLDNAIYTYNKAVAAAAQQANDAIAAARAKASDALAILVGQELTAADQPLPPPDPVPAPPKIDPMPPAPTSPDT
jgi:hypothetical protein